ncbi:MULTISPECIES: DUF7455 domain-containing protein [Brachybacterium]|uniref:DUF7455 domain-containing protein n=1 Tax=Brachybacterium kimchii TaxID=2942909 RepID=A0ABY4N7Q6_9MICO|nr:MULTISPECIES: hypothetical protein [Brachybacterium]MCG7308048.1 hypothetical protein [Brachybacterium sp. ACRRE]UQN30588.1 hypothetical protein M4486_04545 [Brachybacterium kimchii]
MSTATKTRAGTSASATEQPRADILFGQTPTVSSEAMACDRCPSASAKVKVILASGTLYLCGFHARRSWDLLERMALRIRADLPGDSYYLPMGPR